ncbi:MAG TPA: tRNA uridine-5-carboxymethylaminomethyl(34) synthesis GTPase MnmE [Terriglobia bacterium]|nr:tRNA uridine-5-carboxymethylaminomethyl(34) synthesis GTPase MnmE [Terriglobia bacterium]
MSSEDTIVAVATPPGRGGIGVIRLSGERAVEIACGLIHVPKPPLETRHATLGEFRDPKSGRALDEVVVTVFRRPHSYTGEDVAELSCHGAPVILGYLVECCLEHGARAAEPGEFTMRAFLNGRLDLTQAEAVRDLIESRTLFQARLAAQQLEGSVSARLKPHKQALVDLIARLEAGIDFAEDDLPVSGWDEILTSLDVIRADLDGLAAGYEYGRVVREGLSLAIVGRPNVGKSSLFNRLLNEERAIVTASPGTTRDLVAESAALGGIPLRLVDTAGVREAVDEAEQIGVRKSLQAIADSDLRLLVLDASQVWTAEDGALLERLLPLGALLVALNKSDLAHRLSELDLRRRLAATGGHAANVVWTSALTGEGISELKAKLLDIAAPARDLGAGEALITNLRHQQLIRESLSALGRARQAAAEHIHHEMLLLDLYDALHALDAITGATTVEDVLGVIFSTFCVGK